MIQSSENTAIKTFFQNIIKVLPRVVQGGVLELLQHAPTCPSVPQRAPACPSVPQHAMVKIARAQAH